MAIDKDETNPYIIKRSRYEKLLKCSYCKPHRVDNVKRRSHAKRILWGKIMSWKFGGNKRHQHERKIGRVA